MTSTHLALFQGRQVRKVLHNEEWLVSVVDVVALLTESADASAYWRKLKQRMGEDGGQPVTFCHGLKLVVEDGRKRVMDRANTQGLFAKKD